MSPCCPDGVSDGGGERREMDSSCMIFRAVKTQGPIVVRLTKIAGAPTRMATDRLTDGHRKCHDTVHIILQTNKSWIQKVLK